MIGRALSLLALLAISPGLASAQNWAIFGACCQTAVLLPSGTTGASQLSGITWAGGGQFYVVGDNDPVVYPLSLTIDPMNGVISDATLSPGITLAAGDDLEGLAYDPIAGTLLTADETGPAIREHAVTDGALLQTLAVPPIFPAHRPNLSLESLTRAPDGSALWTANEEALTVDGPVSSTSAGTIVRLQRFDATFAANGQWAYVTDPLPGDIGAPGRDFEVSGVVDLVALDDGRLLALERGLGGLAFRSRIYEVDVTGATDVSAIADLSSATFTPVSKILLRDGIENVNLEGMTLGPILDNGVRSLLLVSDDAGAGGSNQLLRHMLLRANPPVCDPQPRSGCLAAGASKLVVVGRGGPRDKLTWSWRNGTLADTEDLLGEVYTEVAGAEALGPIAVLINNAGMEVRGPIEQCDDALARRQFETNVFGTLRVMRAVLPLLRARRRGTIVNVSSVAGIVARPYGGLYSASKHALEAISEALHYEVKPFGVRVVLVEPGQYATALLDNMVSARGFDDASPYWTHSQGFDAHVQRLAGGAPADPDEVARIIYDAVHDPQPRLRYLAGVDAHLAVGAYRQLDFEAYEQAMRGAMDWWD